MERKIFLQQLLEHLKNNKGYKRMALRVEKELENENSRENRKV